MDLNTAAKSAQEAGRKAVRDAMEARGRDSPFEISEAWIKIAILQRFLAEARKQTPIGFRVLDELKLENITNIEYGADIMKSHPVDIVLLYPLLRPEQGEVDPWSDPNCDAVGLVEIKKDHVEVIKDAKLLGRVSPVMNRDHPLKWQLLAVLINGESENKVIENANVIAKEVGEYKFDVQTKLQPEEAPRYSKPETKVKDRWFDFMCYGRALG